MAENVGFSVSGDFERRAHQIGPDGKKFVAGFYDRSGSNCRTEIKTVGSHQSCQLGLSLIYQGQLPGVSLLRVQGEGPCSDHRSFTAHKLDRKISTNTSKKETTALEENETDEGMNVAQ